MAGKTDLITKANVLRTLAHHIGKRNGIKGEDLCGDIMDEAMDNVPTYINDHCMRKLRNAIQDARTEGSHICGLPGEGYYMAENEKELIATCKFLYSRAETTWIQIARMRGIALPDLKGQLKLPT